MTGEPSVLRVGALAAFGVGLAYLLSAVAFLAQAPVLRGAGTPHEFWMALAAGAPAHLAVHWLSAVAGLLGLAVVPAAWRLARSRDGAGEGWSVFASALAAVGFAVTARSHLMEVELDLRVAPLYPDLPPDAQAVVPLVAGLALDVPHGWLTLGGIGVWVVVVSALGARNGRLPRALAALGHALGACFLAAVVGFSALWLPLVTVGIGVGGTLLAPAWFAALGVTLRRRARELA